MKKSYLLSSVMLAAALAAPAVSAAGIEHGNRTFYGFFLSNQSFVNAEYGQYGFASQTFGDLYDNTLFYEMTGNKGLYAAAAIDGIYYAFPYQFTSSMEEPVALPAFKLNIYTKRVEELGPWKIAEDFFKVWDATYDLKNDRLLVVGYSPASGGAIYEVNRTTGALTKLRQTPGTLIAADAHGRVFTITLEGDLYQIDMSDPERAIKLLSLPYKSLISHQSLEFDLTNNKLYWAANTLENPHTDFNNPKGDGGKSTWMIEINLPSISPDADYTEGGFSYTEIDELGSFASFLGMYIPYATGGFMAPGHATDVKAVSSVDGTKCDLSFRMPVKTFGGYDLTSIDGYEILRDGVRITTRKGVTPGELCTFTDDNIPAPAEYRYDIVCFSNINGDGPKSPAFAYVGNDRPAPVTGITVDVDNSFTGVTLSWTAPAEGAMGGTFDPANTRYDITRLPDNVEVAKDLTEPRFSDNLNRLLRYSYRITSKNSYGSSTAVSEEFVAGKPVTEFPVEETFDNPTSMLLRWTPVDNNRDGMTWLFGSTLGHSVFGDYETCAEYILSATSVTADQGDADDWLISPPIAFGDDTYGVCLTIRTFSPEHFNVYVGPKNEVGDMTLVESFDANSPVYEEDGRMKFQNYIVTLPESMRNTTGCVAVQLDTKLPGDYSSYFQLANIVIDQAKNLAVSSPVADAAAVSFDGSVIRVTGAYKSGVLYNTSGAAVAELSGAETRVDNLPAGIYIVSIDGRSYKIVRR